MSPDYDYEKLIEDRRAGGDEIEQRKKAERLAELARNLETQKQRLEEQAATPEPPNPSPAPHDAIVTPVTPEEKE